MGSEIHDVQVSKAGCMSEYDGLDNVVWVFKSHNVDATSI